MTNRKFLSFLLAIFMFFSTITPLFAENDSVTVLPPRMAEKEEPQNIVIMENDKDTIPIIDKSEEGGKKIEETPEEPEIKEDNSPVILENREENNNIVILPPIKNEENKEGTTEPSKETEEPEEPKKEKENKKEVKVQVLSKRDAKKPASEGEVNLVLLNDNPADINEEVYDEKIRWKESDFKIEDDKIISLSDEGLLKAKINKKLIIPEMENITVIEKQAFKGFSLRSVEIPKNIKEIKDEAFKDNHLKLVKILGKGKEISENAFNEELVEMYGKCEKEEFLYECEEELEIGKEMVGDALGAVAPDDVSLYTFSGTTITGLSEKGKTYYTDNHNMILPGRNPQGQAITEIGANAFSNKWRGYGLRSVDFSKCTSLTDISYNAFYNNQITNLDLSRCTHLTNIRGDAFKQNHITSLDLSKCTGLTSIGDNAFDGNRLKILDLSKCTSLTSIGNFAFDSNQLKTVKIPLSLKTLTDDAFKGNPGSNDKKQVYLYTPDYTNPNNLKDTSYHLINPVESSDDVTLYTFNGTTITGLSERGKKYFAEHHDMILPGKNPEGQAVTTIGENAFYEKNGKLGLKSVDFKNMSSLINIDNNAFMNNSLTTIDLSMCINLKNIGNDAFYKNFITELNLSGCINITSLGARAFSANEIVNLDLSNCANLINIDNSAFSSNELKTVKIPLSLKTLANNAFEYNTGNNDKKQVYLYSPDYSNPNNLQDSDYHLINPIMGPDDVILYTFNGSTITGLSEAGKKYYATNHNMVLPRANPQGQVITEIGRNAFNNKDKSYNITSVDFKNVPNIIKIDSLSFSGNQLTSLDLSNCKKLTTIGHTVFAGNQISNLDLSGCISLSTIGQNAFGYNNLKTVKIPLSLKTLGELSFQKNPGNNDKRQVYLYTPDYTNPNNLQDGTYHLINPLTGSDDVSLYTFNGTIITGLSERGKKYFETHHDMILPGKNPQGQSITAIGKGAFNNKDSGYGLTSVDFKNLTHLAKIGESSFSRNKLKNLNLSGCTSLTSIEDSAFQSNQLTSLNLSSCTTLTSIGNSAFYSNNLTALNLSECANLKSIGDYVFSNNKIANLDLSKNTNLEQIGTNAFGSNELTSLDLSKCVTLKQIGDRAFEANLLASLNLSGCASLLSIGEKAFHLNMLTSLNLSGCTSLTSIGNSAFWQNQLTNLDLSGCTSLTSIGDYAFNSNQLATLDLSGCINLTSIGSYSFSGNQLKTVKIPLSLKTLSEVSFSGNPGNNDKNQVYLYTPDHTNPNNLKDTDYHLINPITGPDDLSLFTFEGTTLTGLTRRGENYYATFDAPPLTLPGKNPQGELITKVADKAFSSEDRPYLRFKGINFSNCTGLKIIGKESFARGEYGTVDLSPCTNLEVIGESAFYFSSTNTVNLSGLKKLKRIEMGAFSTFNGQNPVNNLNISGCTALEYIGVEAFAYTKIKSLDLSDSVNLKEVGEDAFANHNIVSLNLSGLKNLTKIGMGAFRSEENNLKNVNLSGCTGLEIIEKQAFGWAGLETIDLTPCTNLKTIESQAFVYGKLKTAKIPLSLVNLANDAFMENSGNNYNRQVFLYTPDYTNPNNLRDSRYHLINPITGSDDVSLYTFSGTTITGLSDRGKKYFAEHHDMKLPGKNPQGQAITVIGKKAFYNNGSGYGLTSVDFSNCTSLASIDYIAFSKNQLVSLDLSKCTSLTSIGNGAFMFNQLTSIDLSECESLKNIDSDAFSNNQLTSVDLSACTSLTSVGRYAFYTNVIKTGKIPLSLTNLADNAFQNNSGSNANHQVYLYTPDYTNPNNLPDTDYHLINPITGPDDLRLFKFDGTKLTGLTALGLKYYKEHHNMLLPAKNLEGEYITEITDSAFNGVNLKSVDFSNCSSLAKIGPWAFANNYITSLDLSPCQNLKIIAEHAFDNSHINKIDLSNLSKLETIEKEAFNSNQSTSLTFKNNKNLKNIGKFAFNQNQLTTLDLSGCPNLLNIEEGVFSGGNITSVDLSVVPNISFIGRAAFSDNQITSVNLSGLKNLKSIGEIAFVKNKITNLDLSPCENLEDIGKWSFSENGLNSVNFKGLKNLKTIKYGAFMVNNIKTLDFTDCGSLVNLEEAIFYKNKIENLDMSKCGALKTIPDWIFGENQLKTAKISSSVTSINESSFANNPGNNAKKQVYLYTPTRNNPMNLKDTDYHLVDPITFTIKKVDAKGKPMEGVEFAFYKVDRPAPPAPPAPPQNGTNKVGDTELEISSENVSPAVGGPTISMPDIDLNLNPDGPRLEFFPDPKTVVGVKPIFMTATTDKNGTAEITLPYSPYFLVENKTIPGYSINNTVTQIDATMEGKTIIYTDYEVSIEIPETGTLGVLPYILLALILVVGAYVVLRKKKEEK